MEVFDAKGKFKHWAPLMIEGLCGHPCNDGKLCNSNAGKCSKHRQRELFLMAREDERAVIMERGVCGVPEAGGGPCQQPRGQCSIHTASWHQKRELRAMRAEDDASCIADRGRCGVVPRGAATPAVAPGLVAPTTPLSMSGATPWSTMIQMSAAGAAARKAPTTARNTLIIRITP